METSIMAGAAGSELATLADAVQKAVAASRSRAPMPRHVNRASDVGDPCPAKLTFARTHWADARPVGEELALIFAEGESQERVTQDALRLAGFSVERQQEPAWIEELKLSGHPDGWLRHPILLPFATLHDVKSMHPFVWESIKREEDLDKHPWTAKYRHQMIAYLLAARRNPRANPQETHDLSRGFLVTKCKSTGRIRFVEVRWNETVAEEIAAKCAAINAAVAAAAEVVPYGTTSPWEAAIGRLKKPSLECKKCPWLTTCCPSEVSFGAGAGDPAVIDDPDVIEALAAMEAAGGDVAEKAKAGERARKWLAKRLTGIPIALCGDWEVEGKERSRKMPPQDARVDKWWEIKVKKVGGAALD